MKFAGLLLHTLHMHTAHGKHVGATPPAHHKLLHMVLGPEQEATVTTVKKALSSAPVLKYFNSFRSMSVILQFDGSTCCLASVLLRLGLPVTLARWQLTQTEEGFAQKKT